MAVAVVAVLVVAAPAGVVIVVVAVVAAHKLEILEADSREGPTSSKLMSPFPSRDNMASGAE